MLYTTGLYLATLFWAARDAASRVADRRVVLLLVLLAAVPFIGVALYVLLRPNRTLAEAREAALASDALDAEIARTPRCPTCRSAVDVEWRFCPVCSTVLTHSCPTCTKTIRSGWSTCPFCGVELGVRGWRLDPDLSPVPRSA